MRVRLVSEVGRPAGWRRSFISDTESFSIHQRVVSQDSGCRIGCAIVVPLATYTRAPRADYLPFTHAL